MSIAEHLIENALALIERNPECSYEKFMSSELLKEQAEEVGISMRALWDMAQYVSCVYNLQLCDSAIDEMEKAYGYCLGEEEEMEVRDKIKVYRV